VFGRLWGWSDGILGTSGMIRPPSRIPRRAAEIRPADLQSILHSPSGGASGEPPNPWRPTGTKRRRGASWPVVTKKTTLILPLLAAAVIAAGCGSSYGGGSKPAATNTAAAQAPAAAAATTTVDISGFAFHPSSIQAKVGDKITFTNQDATEHTATATSGATFDSGALAKGKSFTFTATKAGTIKFVCSFHPGMTGTITVAPSGGGDGGGS
jgi:plastocyanin